MKRSLAVLAVLGAFSVAGAHDFWLAGQNDDKLRVQIGFGDGFATCEPIDKERENNFEIPIVTDKNGKKIELKRTSENYKFEGEKQPSDVYVITGQYKPTFWTEDKSGKWHMGGTKDTVKDAKFCRRATMLAKGVINTQAGDLITKPVGERLEIVPLENPANFKANKPFKIKVLFEGKPLAEAAVEGAPDGFLEDMSAFYGMTDDKGEIEVLALKPGPWILKARNKLAFSDPKKCDEETIIASFAFEVK